MHRIFQMGNKPNIKLDLFSKESSTETICNNCRSNSAKMKILLIHWDILRTICADDEIAINVRKLK